MADSDVTARDAPTAAPRQMTVNLNAHLSYSECPGLRLGVRDTTCHQVKSGSTAGAIKMAVDIRVTFTGIRVSNRNG